MAELPLGASAMMHFSSFGSFGVHLINLAARGGIFEHDALETACAEIEKLAKDKIGDYQPQAGPFAAWKSLADSTREQKEALGYAPPDNPLLRTGELRDSIEHKVVGTEGHVGSDSDIAVYQELGTSSIPARSFLGGAAFELAPQIAGKIGVEYVAFLSGGGNRIAVK